MGRVNCLQLKLTPSAASVHFSSFIDWVVGRDRRLCRDSLPVFSAESPYEQFWHGQGCPVFGTVHPPFFLPTTASPTLQGALKDGLGEAVVVCDMPEPCKFPSLDSRQRGFLWTHEEADFTPLFLIEAFVTSSSKNCLEELHFQAKKVHLETFASHEKCSKSRRPRAGNHTTFSKSMHGKHCYPGLFFCVFFFFFLVVFDQCCWLLYCCWLPSRALLSSLLLSCCTQCYCEALRALKRDGAL